jgi:hypothetical protein
LNLPNVGCDCSGASPQVRPGAGPLENVPCSASGRDLSTTAFCRVLSSVRSLFRSFSVPFVLCPWVFRCRWQNNKYTSGTFTQAQIIHQGEIESLQHVTMMCVCVCVFRVCLSVSVNRQAALNWIAVIGCSSSCLV